MSSSTTAQYRAVFLQKNGTKISAELQSRDIPKPVSGSVIVRILAASVRANSPEVYRDPFSNHQLPFPFVPGHTAIGRVFDAASDATKLKKGQLVFFDPYIQARDRGGIYVSGLMEGFNADSLNLSRGEWRDSTYADYAKLPLENCHPLDEERLLGEIGQNGLGYTVEDLTHLFSMLVPFGGLADMDLKPGDYIIIAPATGRHGSAAVHLALAMGAHVIAIGRNTEVLSHIASINSRISTVTLTNNVERDTKSLREACRGPIDAFWDMSPMAAESSTHFRSCLNVLKPGAQVCLCGSPLTEVKFSYLDILIGKLKIAGSWMSTPEQTQRLIRLVETGLLPLGQKAGMGPVRTFALEDWEKAWDAADLAREPGEIVIAP
ncbi:hypothetical protein EsH8_XII_000064 [Colletotrichum jinshuiense]